MAAILDFVSPRIQLVGDYQWFFMFKLRIIFEKQISSLPAQQLMIPSYMIVHMKEVILWNEC